MLKAQLKASFSDGTSYTQTYDKSPLQRLDPSGNDYYQTADARTLVNTWAALLDGGIAIANNLTSYESESISPSE